MPSATLSLNGHDDTTAKVFTLVGNTAKGASFKDAARALALPLSLDVGLSIGAPGQLGNDRITISVKNAVLNSTTKKVSVGSVKLEVSIPRDDAWVDGTTEEILAYIAHLLVSANRVKIADGTVP